MEFGKFLKKESYLDHHHGINAIRTIDLGEWVWKMSLPNLITIVEYRKDTDAWLKSWILWRKDNIGMHDFCVYFEIAIVCLGKKEIRKRLRKLRGKIAA